jgi:predicted ester cyclase
MDVTEQAPHSKRRPTMSVEENKAIVRELIEGWQDPNVLDKLIDANIVLHPGDSTGLDAYKQGCANNLAGFPDMHITIEDIVAAGDRVAARYTQTGTHMGEWAGFAPTGKPASAT